MKINTTTASLSETLKVTLDRNIDSREVISVSDIILDQIRRGQTIEEIYENVEICATGGFKNTCGWKFMKEYLETINDA